MEEDKLAIITGGAGFLGSHLSELLIKKKWKVIIFDNFSDFYDPSIKWRNAVELENIGVKIVKGDILNGNFFSKLLKKTINNSSVSPIIFHLAAQPGVSFCETHSKEAQRVNVRGTFNVLKAIIENNYPKMIFASSSCAFGESEYIPIDEKHPKNPISVYGKSKLAGEEIILDFKEKYPDFNFTIIRPFSAVGIRQRPDMAIHNFIKKIILGEKIRIYGDGESTRDWTHVKDIVNGFYLASKNDKLKDEIFNIGFGKNLSLNYTIKVIANTLQKEAIVEYINKNRFEIKHSCADINFAKERIGYKPKYQFFDAITEMITCQKKK